MAASVRVDGEMVAKLRVEAGYDRTAAAEILGISRVGLWKIETTGRTSPATLYRISRLLKVGPSRLVMEEVAA